MAEFTLVIGNKNYSSWSLRAWLVMKHFQIPFEEILIALYTPTARDQIAQYSPSKRVPVLLHNDLTIWDSLAICEYLAEFFSAHLLYPGESSARAIARSVSAEMHSGFMALRQNMPMDCRSRYPGQGMTPEVQEDIERITTIWKDCRSRFGQDGNFLFGHFSIADAMYAPVVCRFVTYNVPLDPVSQAYAHSILELPAMQEWLTAAANEPETIPQQVLGINGPEISEQK